MIPGKIRFEMKVAQGCEGAEEEPVGSRIRKATHWKSAFYSSSTRKLFSL